MEKLRVAVIGCGNISVMHLDSIKAFDAAELVAVCDVKEDRATAASKKYGGKVYTDYNKMFAEEKKNGTIELLLTKPLSDISIIFSKFLAGIILVIISILPTLIYIIAVYQLGSPKGNLDLGGIMGSYLGLVFLGAIFVAIGIFCSSLTDNQIIAFILSVVLSAFMYIGFEFVARIPIISEIDLLIRSLGINHHYSSISRGVIDTRDVIYYLSAIGFFLLLTKLCLESRNWKK